MFNIASAYFMMWWYAQNVNWCLKMSNWGNAKAERYVHQFSPLLPWTLHRGSKDYKKICGPESEQREIKDFENVNPEVWQNNVSGSIALVVLISCIWPIVREYDTETVPVWYKWENWWGGFLEIFMRWEKICILCKDGFFQGPTLQTTETKRRKLFKANNLDL